ncbi:replicative DNA helicase, partial [Proteus mirabilis]|uniref:replicative DNA helicase n=1 Tax=Proteus mirabilis TaxID=584 RepID=UPI002576FF17
MINTEFEASVIGGLLISGLTPDASDVLATLEPESFSVRFYREAYQVIQKQAKSRGVIDMMMVAEGMGSEHLANIIQTAKDCPSAANLKGYAKMVTDNHNRRAMIQLMDSVRGVIENGTIEQASEAMESFLAQASDIHSSKGDIAPVHVSSLIEDYTEVLQERVNKGEESDTLKTGIRELDEIMGGINPVDLVIIAARPGMGKTEIALKITEGVASQNVIGTDTKKGVLIFSMEMDSQQIVERQIAGSANLSVSALRNPSRM